MECIITGMEVVPQIDGLNDEVIAMKIAVLVDNSLVIKDDSFLIVSVSITFSNSPDPIKIVQNLSSNNIIKGYDIKSDLLNLEGTFWFHKNTDEIKIVYSNVDIYYING